MKKILFLTPSFHMGGMEKVLVTYANMFACKGHEVTVINYTGDDPAIVGSLDGRIRYCNYFRPVPNLFNASLKDLISFNFRVKPYDKWLCDAKPEVLHKKVIAEKYDVEIAFFGAELYRLVSGCKDPSVLRLCWVHSENTEGISRIIRTDKDMQKIFSNIDNVICVSNKVKENVSSIIPWHKGVVTVYNPIDVDYVRRLASDKTDVPQKKAFTFVTVCRLSVECKGLDRLLKAVKSLEAEYAFEVWLIGDGDGKEYIENAIKEQGIRSVKLFGQQNNPYKYMSIADAVLCTSRYEGFSIVMAEAVTLGKVILTTDVSGAEDMLGNSEYGLIVQNSYEGIVEGMKTIMNDSALRARYSKRIRERSDMLSADTVYNNSIKNILEGKE